MEVFPACWGKNVRLINQVKKYERNLNFRMKPSMVIKGMIPYMLSKRSDTGSNFILIFA